MGTEGKKVDSKKMRGVDQTRRALIHAGWIIPAVLALQLERPSTAFADSLILRSPKPSKSTSASVTTTSMPS